jgi:prohibitin 1
MPFQKLRSFVTRTKQWIRKYSVYLSIALLTLLFFALLLSNRIVHNIGPGERGVRWSRFGGGTVLDRVYNEGIRLIPPWDLMYVYNVRVQELHSKISVLAANGLPMTVEYSCRYHPEPSSVPSLHQRYGPSYVQTMIEPEVVSALRVVLGNYRPEEIYARDEQGLLDEIYSVLEGNVTNQYVVVQDILIKELRLTAELEDAINKKLVQEQNALAYEFRLKLEESERQRKSIEAEGIASFQEISKISIVQWRGIEATLELAKSPNSKTIIVGTSSSQMPIILGAER